MVRLLLQVRTPISRRLKARSEEEDNQTVELIIKNDKELVKVPKTSAFNIISIIASILILSGFSYLIYEKYN